MKKSLLLVILSIGLFANLGFTQTGDGKNGSLGFAVVPTGDSTYKLPGNVQDTISAAYGIPNVLMKNDFNIFSTPGNLFHYGTAYAEIWNEDPWGGFTLKGPFGLKTAIFINRPYTGNATRFLTNQPGLNLVSYGPLINTLWGAVTPSFSPVSDLTVLTPRNYFDILIGGKLGDVGGFGIKFTYALNSALNRYNYDTARTNRGTDGTITNSRFTADHHLTLGLSFNQLLFFSGFDLSADIGFLSFDNRYLETFRTNRENANLEAKSVPGANLSFMIRPMISLPNDGLLIFVFSLNFVNTSAEYTSLESFSANGTYTNHATDQNVNITVADQDTIFSSGLALHTQPAEKLKIIYSLGFTSESRVKTSQATAFGTNNGYNTETDNIIDMPLAFSIEDELAPWFKLRFGISQIIYHYKQVATMAQNVPLVITEYNSIFDKLDAVDPVITLGTGILPVKNLEIDLALTADILNITAFIGRASVRFHY